MKFATISLTGKKRKENQDSFCLIEDEGLFVIADGMGGHQGGETASRIAIEEIEKFFRYPDTIDITLTDIDVDPVQQRLKNLKHAIRQASRTIQREAKIHPQKAGMGTTVVVLQLIDNKAFILHVGDSRLYRIQGREIRQVTKDHSRLQELIDAQQISPEEAENYPFKNVITRALGGHLDIEIDTASFPYSESDAFLLCTDGITGVMSDKEICSTIGRHSDDPKKALQAISEIVEDRGSPDNYTAILLLGNEFSHERERERQENTAPIQIDRETASILQGDRAIVPPLNRPSAGRESISTPENQSADVQAEILADELAIGPGIVGGGVDVDRQTQTGETTPVSPAELREATLSDARRFSDSAPDPDFASDENEDEEDRPEDDSTVSDDEDDDDADIDEEGDTESREKRRREMASFLSDFTTDGEIELLEKPAPGLAGFKLYEEGIETVAEPEPHFHFGKRKRKKSTDEPAKSDSTAGKDKRDARSDEQKMGQIKKARDSVERKATIKSPDILEEPDEPTGAFRLRQVDGSRKSDFIMKLLDLSPRARKYIVLILLLMGFYLTLCVMNSLTFWVQYSGEANSLLLMKGRLHPFERKTLRSINVVPHELWMMMIQNQEIKTALNQGKSFFRFEDMYQFISALFLDVGKRYLSEGGEKEHLIAADLFQRAMEYEKSETVQEYLLKALYQIGRDAEDRGENKQALNFYGEVQKIDSAYRDVAERVERLRGLSPKAPPGQQLFSDITTDLPDTTSSESGSSSLESKPSMNRNEDTAPPEQDPPNSIPPRDEPTGDSASLP